MTHRLLRLYTVLALSGLIAIIHILAIQKYWYWTYSWLDLLVHFLGGMLIGSMFLAFAYFRARDWSVGIFLTFVLCVGISWEVFEYWGGVPMEVRYVPDTILDLVMDLYGALATYVANEWLRASHPS